MSTLRELVDVLPGAPSWWPWIRDAGWTEVARYPATAEEASEVIVYVHRMPAAFFKIESADLDRPLTTGSVDPEFVESIALALAGGILRSERDGDAGAEVGSEDDCHDYPGVI